MKDYRKVMEQKLGRKLASTEIVHHKDGDSHNNDPENLVLTNKKEHHSLSHLISKDWENVITEILDKGDDFRGISLNEGLSVFFTSRQKQIIFRKVHRLSLSKTEREYYSRVIKKKMIGLANPMLQKLANHVLYP